MENPLKPNGFITTPESVEALAEWLNLLSGSECTVAVTAAGMAWNLASQLVQEEINKTGENNNEN